MTRHPILPRFRCIALWLAFLAVLSHVGMSLASVQHHARMLGSHAAGWTEVCTPSGTKRIALPVDGRSDRDENSAAMARLADCLVCVAAVSSFPPPDRISHFPLEHQIGARAYRPARVDAVLQSILSLRPPPRAPPRHS